MKALRDIIGPKISYSRYAILIFLLMILSSIAKAQDTLPSKLLHPELYVNIQGKGDLYLVNSTRDTAKAEWVAAAYEFDMVFDSTAVTTYTFTECKRNGTLLRFVLWDDGRVVNADADVLSFNSTTDTFVCHTGDTLSFYRQLTWRNPTTSVQDTGQYYSLDSLDFSVELVRISDSTRIALLDTIGILANPQPSAPRIHGMRPLMSMVNYIVPSALNSTNAFLRIRLYHRGTGPYWFTRQDQITIGLSQQLNDSDYQDFINIFTPTAPKPQAQDLESLSSRNRGKAALSVRPIPGSHRDFEITFNSDPKGGPVSLVIYDIMGNVEFYPYTSSGSQGKTKALYTLEESGIYFIALFHDGKLVAVKKIATTQ